MKLQIGTYEVEITVKDEYSIRANKIDTQYFLNELSCYLSEAEKSYDNTNFHELSENVQSWNTSIYEELAKQGFYK